MVASSPTEKPSNILLTTDLTPACDRALDRAVQLAIERDAALTVCHVVEASSHRPWGVERRVKNAETEMQRLVARSRSSLKERLSCHVLVGDPPERAIEYARGISSDFAYQVTPEFGGSNADKSMDVVEAEEKARVIHAAKQDLADLYAFGEGQATPETVLEQGSPEAVLTAYVERHWPDLVVTGTHGRSGAQQAVIGSVAEGLLQSLPCDVLAVPAGQ